MIVLLQLLATVLNNGKNQNAQNISRSANSPKHNN